MKPLNEPDRLQKILAQAGVVSRRGAERLIQAGRVRVNGQVVTTLGFKANPAQDRIEVDGQLVGGAEELVYYLFYKPEGYITSINDPQGRPTIVPFLAGLPARVYPVGRLDRDAEGLLILTNDGELARRLMHPRFHVAKTYRVKVEGHPTPAALARLASGQLLIGDRAAGPADVELIKQGEDRAWLKLTIYEGRHHQVKRMCSQIGHSVLKLKRIEYGPLDLGRLAPGELRPLKSNEIRSLKKAAGMILVDTGRSRRPVG